MKQILTLLGFFLFLIYRYFSRVFMVNISEPAEINNSVSTYSVLIEKKDDEPLGMRIGGFDDGNGVNIDHTTENGVAEKAGVKKGSKILKIDDVNCEKLDYGKVLEIIKNSGDKFRMELIENP